MTFMLGVYPVLADGHQDNRPNVLLISIDDLNDWVGCMPRPELAEGGGHPQARTPNIDALAARGMLFSNAHCQSPVCNPSRASMMTSLYPSTTGIYFLNPDLDASPIAMKNTLLPHRFADEGYHVTGAGKLFHGNQNRKYLPEYAGSFGAFGPHPKKKLGPFPGHPLWDWGAYPDSDEEMPDHRIADWGAAQLETTRGKPLFLATGFYRPHVPQYAPQKWFDMYPMHSLRLPVVGKNDLDDVSEYAVNLTRLKHVAPAHEWVVKNNEWKPLVQSYLACVSFVDHQVGRLLAALDSSPYMDIYPTLLDAAGLEMDAALEGHSLAPLLKDPEAAWPYMAQTSFGPGNCAVRSERYRYIHYNDGTEEFYDHARDPHEWENLIHIPEWAERIEEHREFLPRTWHRILGKDSTGHSAFAASEAATR